MPHRPPRVPNAALRQARLARGWSQEELAERLGTHGFTVSRWELGQATPGPYYRQQLSTLFACSSEDLGLRARQPSAPPVPAPQEAPPPSHPFWSVPLHRNPYFLGREDPLSTLAAELQAAGTAAVTQAISGLGGMGKTQLALEYCYRFREAYQAVVWLSAQTWDTLLADLDVLAARLDLPERYEAKQERLVAGFTRWLETQEPWLLVLDNVEEFALARAVVPTASRGHLLLTTRLQATRPLADPLVLESFSPEEGTRFLLTRAGLVAAHASSDQVSAEEQEAAQTLTEALGGLPLALDQAGAYLEETACGLSEYLQHFQTHASTLLERRGSQGWDHPDSVLTTFTLAFTRLHEASPAAADLLCCCAFLAPDAIPESLLAAGASELGPLLGPLLADPLAWDRAIGALRQLSFIRRDPGTQSLALHRLVQATIRDTLSPDEQRRWAERSVRALELAFPEVRFATWETCQQYLPHAQLGAEWIQQWHLATPEGGRLLTRVGTYLTERGHYASAETLLTQALHLCEQHLGPGHPDVADSLVSLAQLSIILGQYPQAETLAARALTIQLQALGSVHPTIARTLSVLGQTLNEQGQFARSVPLYQQALGLYDALGWEEHPETASTLLLLGNSYRIQGKLAEALPLLQRALAIRERTLTPADPQVAFALNSLAVTYDQEGQYALAEPLYQRVLAIREQTLGPTHPDLAETLYNLGGLFTKQGRYQLAEELLTRALQIVRTSLGAQHETVAYTLHRLATIHAEQGRDGEAEALLQQALAILEHQLGSQHQRVGFCLRRLALLATRQGRYDEARAYLERAITIFADAFGPEQEYTAQCLSALAQVQQLQGEEQQAEALYQQALGIYAQSGGQDRPGRAEALAGLADLYATQGRRAQAEQLFQEALALRERLVGAAHPEVIALRAQYQAAMQQRQQEPTPLPAVADQAEEETPPLRWNGYRRPRQPRNERP